MCIIIAKPAKRKIKTEYYHNSFKHNKDGAGIAYVDNNELKIKKGIFNEKEFVDLVESMEEQSLLIHCRVATHGSINAENCHPFLIKCPSHPEFTFAVAHNGQLAWRSTKKQSDTVCFIEDFLAPLLDQNPWFLEQPFCPDMLEKFIGVGNKLVIMRYDSEKKETEMHIINEIMGSRGYGCWFSNTTHMWPRVKPSEQQYGVWADGYGPHGGVQAHLPGVSHYNPPAKPYVAPNAPLKTAAEIANSISNRQNEKSKNPILQDFGDWWLIGGKYLNINASYTGSNKATPEQREQCLKQQADKLNPPKPEPAKNNGNILGLPSGQDPEEKQKEITVPREPGVIEEPKEEAEILSHLCGDDMKKLRRMAADYFRPNRAYNMKGKKTSELLEDLRFDLRYYLPHMKLLDDVAIDKELLRDGDSQIADLEIKIAEEALSNARDNEL